MLNRVHHIKQELFWEHFGNFWLGVCSIAMGIWLMGSDNYFSWPPPVASLFNDDVFGFMFVVVGLSNLIWSLSSVRTAMWNRAQLTLATYLWSFLGIYQLIHVIVFHLTHWFWLPVDMPWISNLTIAGFIIFLARRSDSRDH